MALRKKEAYACTKEHKVNHRRTKKRKCLSGKKKIMDKEKKSVTRQMIYILQLPH